MNNDHLIIGLIAAGRLRVNASAGLVYAPKSNTPTKPVGAYTRKGYLRVCISTSGRRVLLMAHRIVWVSAHGPLPDGHEVDHRNRVKDDNRIENLEAVTRAVNMVRATRAGAFKNAGRKDGIRDHQGRFGKKAAGRMLDGRTWDEVPQ